MATTDRKPILLDFEKPLAELEEQIKQIRDLANETEVDVTEKIAQLEDRATQLRKEIFSSLTPQQRLQVARHPRRPTTLDYIQAIKNTPGSPVMPAPGTVEAAWAHDWNVMSAAVQAAGVTRPTTTKPRMSM